MLKSFKVQDTSLLRQDAITPIPRIISGKLFISPVRKSLTFETLVESGVMPGLTDRQLSPAEAHVLLEQYKFGLVCRFEIPLTHFANVQYRQTSSIDRPPRYVYLVS